jgi:predicted HTH transcriptional regulator
LLIIPAAVKVPTSFDKVRYGRIGSSKIKLEKYPEREAILWNVLFNGYPTMINTESPIQDLTFNQLKNYYLSKNMLFNDSNFINNMHLKTSNGKFNMLACFLADNGEIPVRVSIFSGVTKADRLFSVKEFGNQSLVSVIDRIIDYSDSINMTKSIEHFDKGYREDVPLFNQECFNEALKNAFIHNNWLRRVSPMVTFYNDRVEIISFSKLAPRQTIEGFYKGNSIPVNEDLSSIFLATHLSERTGKGMPLLVSTYGKNIFELSDESIKVTIPYNWQHKFEELVDNQVDKLVDKLSKTEKIVFDAIKDNPHLSQPELAIRCNVGKTTIQNVIIKLKKLNLIERVGSNKTGYWKIKE